MRFELVEFAEAMEAKLKKNDHKSNWKDQTLWCLVTRLMEEVIELYHAFLDGGDVPDEAVDVADFAMMIYNKAKHKEKK